MSLRLLGSLDTLQECEASEIALVIEDATADRIAALERAVYAELPRGGRGWRAMQGLEREWITREAEKVAAALAVPRTGRDEDDHG